MGAARRADRWCCHATSDGGAFRSPDAPRTIDIQTLAGVMTLADSALTSALKDESGVMSGATSATTGDPRGEVLKQLYRANAPR